MLIFCTAHAYLHSSFHQRRIIDSDEYPQPCTTMAENHPSNLPDTAGWARLGYVDWPNRPQPDLRDTDHPMFRKRRFIGTAEDYEMISPAIRLASHLLCWPKSMLFIYSLVYECKTLPSEFDHDGRPCFQFRRTLERDEHLIRKRVDRIFQEMGSHFTFVCNLLLFLPPIRYNSAAHTSYCFERDEEAREFRPCPDKVFGNPY